MTFEITNNLPEDKIITVDGQKIAVKQYVPIQKKLEAIQTILSLSLDPQTGLYLRGHVTVFKYLYQFYLYTDIEFKPEDKDNPMALYDALYNSTLAAHVISALPIADISDFNVLLEDFIAQFEMYQTSAYGILDSLSKDYKDLDYNIDELQKKLTNKENIKLVDEIVTKLG